MTSGKNIKRELCINKEIQKSSQKICKGKKRKVRHFDDFE